MNADSIDGLRDTLLALQAEHQQMLAQIRRDQQATIEIARRAWRVQEDERGRLARELHDGLGQNLTALKNDLTRLQAELPQDAAERVGNAIELCAGCLADTRSMARILRPAMLDDFGLASALRQLCRTVEAEGIATEFIERGDLDNLSRELGTVVYRLVQEATTNLLKHAQATTYVVQINVSATQLQLIVMDDGRGFDAADDRLRRDGFGLQGMRERVELFGGTIEIDSRDGDGTRIRVELPRMGGRGRVA